jgi:hypothetical protein
MISFLTPLMKYRYVCVAVAVSYSGQDQESFWYQANVRKLLLKGRGREIGEIWWMYY